MNDDSVRYMDLGPHLRDVAWLARIVFGQSVRVMPRRLLPLTGLIRTRAFPLRPAFQPLLVSDRKQLSCRNSSR